MKTQTRSSASLAEKRMTLRHQEAEGLTDDAAAKWISKVIRKRSRDSGRVHRSTVSRWRLGKDKIFGRDLGGSSGAKRKKNQPRKFAALASGVLHILFWLMEAHEREPEKVKVVAGDVKKVARTVIEVMLGVMRAQADRHLVMEEEEQRLVVCEKLEIYERCQLSKTWVRGVLAEVKESRKEGALKRMDKYPRPPLSIIIEGAKIALDRLLVAGVYGGGIPLELLHGFCSFRQVDGGRGGGGDEVEVGSFKALGRKLCVSREDINKVLDGRYLTDNIILSFCAAIQSRNERRIQALGNPGDEVPRLWIMDPIELTYWVKRLGKKSFGGLQKQILKAPVSRSHYEKAKEADVLVFPVTRDGVGTIGSNGARHWTVVAIFRKARTVVHLCSLGGDDGRCDPFPSASALCARFADRLCNTCGVGKKAEKFKRETNKVQGKYIPLQPDLTSCGAFVCRYVNWIESRDWPPDASEMTCAKGARRDVYDVIMAGGWDVTHEGGREEEEEQ